MMLEKLISQVNPNVAQILERALGASSPHEGTTFDSKDDLSVADAELLLQTQGADFHALLWAANDAQQVFDQFGAVAGLLPDERNDSARPTARVAGHARLETSAGTAAGHLPGSPLRC